MQTVYYSMFIVQKIIVFATFVDITIAVGGSGGGATAVQAVK